MKLPFETRHLKSLAFFVPALLLVLAIGMEIEWGNRIGLPLPQPQLRNPRSAPAPLQPEFSLPPLDQNYTDMLLQPLFVPTRRPPPPLQVEPRSTMQKGQFTLEGIILTKEKNLALLREIATNKILRVEQGKEIKGIQLVKMEKRSITLKQGDESEEVVLKIPPKPKPLPQPALAMPGAPPQSASPPAPPPGSPAAAPEPYNAQNEIARRRALRGLPP